jgi:hypothetical protein
VARRKKVDLPNSVDALIRVGRPYAHAVLSKASAAVWLRGDTDLAEDLNAELDEVLDG